MSMSKFRRDHLANKIVAEQVKDTPEKVEGKNAAAVLLGKLGGLKGGKARAAALSPQRRREIAIAAANARWKKKYSLSAQALQRDTN